MRMVMSEVQKKLVEDMSYRKHDDIATGYFRGIGWMLAVGTMLLIITIGILAYKIWLKNREDEWNKKEQEAEAEVLRNSRPATTEPLIKIDRKKP